MAAFTFEKSTNNCTLGYLKYNLRLFNGQAIQVYSSTEEQPQKGWYFAGEPSQLSLILCN